MYAPVGVKTEGNAASGQRIELATRLSLAWFETLSEH